MAIKIIGGIPVNVRTFAETPDIGVPTLATGLWLAGYAPVDGDDATIRCSLANLLAFLLTQVGGGGSQRGVVSIDPTDESAVITFPTAFAAIPTNILLTVAVPSEAGASFVSAYPDLSSITTTGFSARFSPPGLPGHKIMWQAAP